MEICTAVDMVQCDTMPFATRPTKHHIASIGIVHALDSIDLVSLISVAQVLVRIQSLSVARLL